MFLDTAQTPFELRAGSLPSPNSKEAGFDQLSAIAFTDRFLHLETQETRRSDGLDFELTEAP